MSAEDGPCIPLEDIVIQKKGWGTTRNWAVINLDPAKIMAHRKWVRFRGKNQQGIPPKFTRVQLHNITTYVVPLVRAQNVIQRVTLSLTGRF